MWAGVDSGQSTTATGVFGMDVLLQYPDFQSVWAEPSATVHGLSECLGWTVSYITWILRVFGLDCQQQYKDFQTAWAGPSNTVHGFTKCLAWTVGCSNWILRVFGLDCQLSATVPGFPEGLAGLSVTVPGFSGVWAGLSAVVTGFLEYLGWTASYSIWIPGVFGLDRQLQFLNSRSVWAGLSPTIPGFPECIGWTVS
jgi:hypothetical protein